MIATDTQTPCQSVTWLFDEAMEGRHKATVDQARRVCQDCPVKAACHQMAVDTKSHGVWGGEFFPPKGYVDSRRDVCQRGHDTTGPNGTVRPNGSVCCRTCKQNGWVKS